MRQSGKVNACGPKLHKLVEAKQEEEGRGDLENEQRIALEPWSTGRVKGCDLLRTIEVEEHLRVTLVPLGRIGRSGPQEESAEPGWEVRVKLDGISRGVKVRSLEALDLAVRKSGGEGL